MEPCLLTTVMGAFPKPDSVPVSDWFDLSDRDYTARWADEMEAAGDEAKALFARAATEVAARLPRRCATSTGSAWWPHPTAASATWAATCPSRS